MPDNSGMHNALSKDQLNFLAQKINENEGFSVKAVGPAAGTPTADAYLVGIAGLGKDFPVDKPIKGSQIKRFAKSNEEVLAQPEMSLGGFQAQNPTRASLDVSQEFPTTPEGLQAARLEAAASNQEGIGELDPMGGYSGTIDNPYYNYAAGQRKQRPQVTLFEGDWAATGNVDPAAVDVVTAGPNWPKIKKTRPVLPKRIIEGLK
jgi:hypothetical protein